MSFGSFPLAVRSRFMLQRLTRRKFLYGVGALLLTFRLPSTAAAAPTASLLDCPIFYFHEVSNYRTFAQFVISLLLRKRHPVSLSALVAFMETGQPQWPEDTSPFVLSFDDGLLSQKLNALPFLWDWKVPGVFAVMPRWGGDGRHRYMRDEDFRELADLGMEVISHTFNHASLPSLRRRNLGAWQAEIVQSKQALEEITGRPVDFFCYPSGAYDRETVELVARHYKAALATRRGTLHSSDELYLLRRERRS